MSYSSYIVRVRATYMYLSKVDESMLICYPSHCSIWSPLDLLSLLLHLHHLVSTCMQSARLMIEASSRNLKW